LKILLVVFERSLQSLFAVKLRDHELFFARDTEEAWSIIEKTSPDGIIIAIIECEKLLNKLAVLPDPIPTVVATVCGERNRSFSEKYACRTISASSKKYPSPKIYEAPEALLDLILPASSP